MKTIILNDLNSKWETIIPYGLHLAKSLESETDVLHVIDSRMHQAQYTSYSDSQSITPDGNTLSQSEIIQRERNRANLQFDKTLSAEVSRLNYPLKVNREIAENSIVDELQKRAEENSDSLFIISSEPDNYNFDSADDILSTLKESGIKALLVPPKTEFKEFKRIILPVDFMSENTKCYQRIQFLTEHFNPLIDAVDVATKHNYADLEMKGEAWKKVTNDFFLHSTLKLNILEGDDFAETFVSYVNRNYPDLILLLQQKADSGDNIFTGTNPLAIAEKTKTPVLLCYA